MAEWYFNSYLLQISLAVVTFLLMNLSRCAVVVVVDVAADFDVVAGASANM